MTTYQILVDTFIVKGKSAFFTYRKMTTLLGFHIFAEDIEAEAYLSDGSILEFMYTLYNKNTGYQHSCISPSYISLASQLRELNFIKQSA